MVEKNDMAEKTRGRLVFLQEWPPIFFPSNAWNPPISIGDGWGMFCLYWGSILVLDSAHKDLNRWLKVVIMNCQILIVKGYLSWPFWASTTAVVVSISQKEPCQGVVKCQTVIMVYGFSSLVERWSIKYPWKVVIHVVFSG